MKNGRASNIDELHLGVGEELKLQSLRQNVVPPVGLAVALVEATRGIKADSVEVLPEDGMHGSVYRLRAGRLAHGELVVAFREIQAAR